MRREGKSLDEIAKALGYAGRQGAAGAIESYRRKVLAADATELEAWVTLQLDRLEAMVGKLWPALTRDVKIGEVTTVEVNLAAMDALLRVFVRQAKLLGLDASDQRAERMVAINQAFADRFLAAMQTGLQVDGVTDELRATIERTVLEVLRAPVQVAALDSRN